MQLRNNIGAATNLFSRSATVTTAIFFINAEGGCISREKVDAFTRLRAPLKASFHSGQRDPITAASECDLKAMPLASKIQSAGGTLWGMTFSELQNELVKRLKSTAGL
jgi:hypothetical protein